jgi:cytochrome c oxidase subunit I
MKTATRVQAGDALAPSRVKGDRLVLAHIYTSTVAIGLGALFGMLQDFSRAGWIVMPAWFDYYRMLTAHGVLMALVFTTFFISGLFTYVTYHSIPRERSTTLGWIAYVVMVIGTVMAATSILSGNASVLYTFYAPLKASPEFYFGLTLVILGTWVLAADIFENVIWWKRQHHDESIPLPSFMAATTMVMWVIATIGVVAEMALLIPWSLGWTQGIDVELSRMLFWYFGHPLVYFWIMGAYTLWYTVVPATYKGHIFNDGLARLAFLMLLLLSTPVGIHHQFLDPGISSGWKFLHTVLTYGVVIPSFMTAFAVFASFEIAARRAGVRGFWNIVRWLPWRNPGFAGPAFGMILFILGGFGGIVNSSYSLDVLVHNTIWVVGHFHVTVGGPVALTFIGASYSLVSTLTGRRLFAPKLALASVYTWFVGMAIMSVSMHIAGVLGAPRRTSDVTYMGSQVAQNWHPEMVGAAIGGAILALAIVMYVVVAIGTLVTNRPARIADEKFTLAPHDEKDPAPPAVFDRLGRWAAIAIAVAILAYAGPIAQQLSVHAYLVPGMRTW